MSLVWFVFKQRAEYKCIKIEEKETSNSIRNKIRTEFGFELRTKFRVRNWRGNLVPINDTLASNSKKNAYKIELYVPMVRTKVSIDSVEKVNRVTTALATKSIVYGFYQKLFRLETAFKFARNQLQKNSDYRLDDLESRNRNFGFYIKIKIKFT
ncbi:hypothetical protein BpHYR1_044768 [Brachionus plicatilis]|uniref:Uncharacterized protein n=1 Tax=Brachionus plicatilis TaxID=10195 RepID=A0A3M7R7M1_BRAPC|nr:hypothetical protein BpHYR1_044768 [Brachionus plicatilis]